MNGATKIKAVQRKKDTKGVKKDHLVVTGVEPGVVRRKPHSLFVRLFVGLSYIWGALFWFSICTDVLLDAITPDTTHVTESGVRQELVETGATLYGFKRTNLDHPDQMTNLGLNYVDCEVEAALCGRMNVTSYPTWQINGQLYAGLSSLEKLSELLGHGCHEPFGPPTTVLRLPINSTYSEFTQRLTLYTIWTSICTKSITCT